MLPRKRRAPSSYEVGTSEPQNPSTARDYYRGLYFEALDCLTSAMKERFNRSAFLVYKKRDEVDVLGASVRCAEKDDLFKEIALLSIV